VLSPPANDSSLFRRAFGGSSTSNIASTTSTTQTTPSSDVSWTADCNAEMQQRRGSLSSLQFGTNIFKRFAERMRSIQDSDPEPEPTAL